jgi:hypothetical protein
MDSFEYFDSNNLQLNIMFLNYLNMSQSGAYDYLFDYTYDENNIKPKINIIKRSSPISKKELVIDSKLLKNNIKDIKK